MGCHVHDKKIFHANFFTLKTFSVFTLINFGVTCKVLQLSKKLTSKFALSRLMFSFSSLRSFWTVINPLLFNSMSCMMEPKSRVIIRWDISRRITTTVFNLIDMFHSYKLHHQEHIFVTSSYIALDTIFLRWKFFQCLRYY